LTKKSPASILKEMVSVPEKEEMGNG